ncbi:MAG: hypothetical protein M1826_005577 [Phylliscum demangeonii]|nr:MAG: hypothetical protein M1826_005577 [Phylliscum demangeonii]
MPGAADGSGGNALPDARERAREPRDPEPRRRLRRALRLQRPKEGVALFAECAADGAVMRSIPATTFSEMLALLRPERQIEPYHGAYANLTTRAIQLADFPPPQALFQRYLGVLKQLVGMRKQAGCDLTPGDYTRLLSGARACGDGFAAFDFWVGLRAGRWSADANAFNHYMDATCWTTYRQTLSRRVMTRRSGRRRLEHMGAMRDRGPKMYESGARMKRVVLRIRQRMLRQAVAGDERTYALLITALARDGDLDAIKQLLKQVWNVDVDALQTKPEPELEPVRPLSLDSPLRPGRELLYALAHGFGIMSQTAMGLQLVDFVARQYRCRIPTEVWAELLDWVYCHSVSSWASRSTAHDATGYLPPQTPVQLWQTMTGPPYRVRPTAAMCDLYIRILHRLGPVHDLLDAIVLGQKTSQPCLRAQADRRRALVLAQRLARRGIGFGHPALAPETIHHHASVGEAWRLQCLRFRARWVRKALTIGHRHHDPEDWQRRLLPRFLRRWKTHRPFLTKYQIDGTAVELVSSDVSARWRQHGRPPRALPRSRKPSAPDFPS